MSDDGIVDYDNNEPTEHCRVFLNSVAVNHGNDLDQFIGTGGEVKATYIIRHDNGKTTLEQKLHLSRTYDGWIAVIEMEEMPHSSTCTAAAWRTADWLERLAKAIKSSTYDQINLNGL